MRAPSPRDERACTLGVLVPPRADTLGHACVHIHRAMNVLRPPQCDGSDSELQLGYIAAHLTCLTCLTCLCLPVWCHSQRSARTGIVVHRIHRTSSRAGICFWMVTQPASGRRMVCASVEFDERRYRAETGQLGEVEHRSHAWWHQSAQLLRGGVRTCCVCAPSPRVFDLIGADITRI